MSDVDIDDFDYFSDEEVGSAVHSCGRAGPVSPPPVPAKWDDDCVRKILCKDSAWVIGGINKRAKSVVRAAGHWPDEVWDDTKKAWVVDPMYMGGEWDPGAKQLTINDGASCEAAAVAIFHEATHAGQPPTMSARDSEYDAYGKTEAWAIKRGLPPQHSSFRTKDAAGNVIPDKAAIRKRVDDEYPGKPEGAAVSTTIAGVKVNVQYQPVDYHPITKETILAAPGTSLPPKRRPPQAGDRVARGLVYTVPPTPVDTKAWKCP